MVSLQNHAGIQGFGTVSGKDIGSSQLKYAECIPMEIGMNNTAQKMPIQMCSSGSHRSNQFRWMDPSASRRPHPATANPMLIASKTAANITMVPAPFPSTQNRFC